MKELKVLGPNEVGKGILIEHDGYISPDDVNNKQIISEAMNNMDFMGDLVLYAVLQKYGVPNKNGRIYPESILKRENEKYQSIIKKGGALNELNHPSCQKPDAQILTENGWKYILDISEHEKIYTLNEHGDVELNSIFEKLKFPYKGKLINIKGRNIDVSVTPNHKFPVINKNTKKLSFITAQEISNSLKDNNKLSNYYIPKRGEFNTVKNDYFVLKGLSDDEFSFRCGEIDKVTYKQDVHIPMDAFMGFMGIYLAEGSINHSKIKKRKYVLSNGETGFYESPYNGYNIRIPQKHPEKIVLIEELLSLLPFNVKKYTSKNGLVNFVITDRRLYKYLKPLGKCYDKYIPEELKNQHPEHLDILFKWFHLGDSRTIGNYSQSDVFSTSEKLITDLQEILIKCGKSGNIRKEIRKKDRYIKEKGNDRLIKGENTSDMWFLTMSTTKGIWLDKRNIIVSEEEYDGFVYSVNVPNHTYYTKSNEKCHWTGNSSLIDLDRVSHSILETWWDGNILMAKIKIFTSPGWKKMGIISCKGDQAANLLMNGASLGISSRGVGSLKNVKGQNIVQDDFEIVCFDLVSSPSTPGAYIFADPSDRDQYAEAEEKVDTTEMDKMKSLMGSLNSFLGK